MDLWIRSQDKMKLVKVNYVYIMLSNEHFIIYGETIDSGPIIGVYESKERALEVLDEIQETLCLDKFNYEDIDKTCYQDCYRYKSDIIAVYEMPKE